MNGDNLAALRRKFARFDWEERRCLVEALLLLMLAAVAVRILPLTVLGRVASAGPFGASPQTPERSEVLIWMVGWAIDRAAKRSPLRALCFEQGMAAQIMLRRRGIDSTLLYGVAALPGSSRPIRAHVWIETAQFPVIGAPEPGIFALLATWPQGRRAIWADCAA
ncbi:lasso peptide biosynthesis B2 protein [Novosphingobium resinovorum]|uniref:lasso peptide biosynthesis B2 protein n=1 Tax=Novosphingobium TaxID=165696 RepID=UPI001B3C6D9F|nr:MULTISPECIES: lasso peptide biosynthesis B2 protein [Novosphingobium]MBF7010226.1 lasso peptide biosynthesis B2 protein [Novosphingobium sp. HR1a]WJM28237.1 lasso peptide biosynthesis B2 protein [Novosphingobium resinovorum]